MEHVADNICLSCRRSQPRHVVVCPHCRGTMAVAAVAGGVPGAYPVVGDGYGEQPDDVEGLYIGAGSEGFRAPAAAQPYPPQPYTARPPAGFVPPLRTWTVGAVIALIVFWPTGIPALVYARRAARGVRTGDRDGAAAASRFAFGWSLTSWILAVVGWPVVIVALAVAAVSYNQAVGSARGAEVNTTAAGVNEYFASVSAITGQPASESQLEQYQATAPASSTVVSYGRSPSDGQVLVSGNGYFSCVTLSDTPGEKGTVTPAASGTATC